MHLSRHVCIKNFTLYLVEVYRNDWEKMHVFYLITKEMLGAYDTLNVISAAGYRTELS